MKSPRLWIDGKWLETRASSDVLNPATGDVIAQVPLGELATLEAAVTAAQQAFPRVRQQPAHQRSAILQAIADGIEKRLVVFAGTIVAEAGKPITFAEAEVHRAIMTFTAAAEEARRPQGGNCSLSMPFPPDRATWA